MYEYKHKESILLAGSLAQFSRCVYTTYIHTCTVHLRAEQMTRVFEEKGPPAVKGGESLSLLYECILYCIYMSAISAQARWGGGRGKGAEGGGG